jgi:undecaprenyl-diphosphatase
MIDHVDLAIMTFLTGFAGKSRMFDHFVNAVSRFDLFKGIALMCLFWFAWGVVKPNETLRDRDERHERLVSILIGSLLIGVLSRCLQLILHIHQRPMLANLHLPFPKFDAGISSLNTWNSFPSDHSMLFFALSTGLWTINRRLGIIAAIWSLIVIDLPRVYLGIHYPSDVVAGAVLGTICMVGFLRLPLARVNNAISAWRHQYPGVFMAIMFFATDEIAHLLNEIRQLVQSTAKVVLHGQSIDF